MRALKAQNCLDGTKKHGIVRVCKYNGGSIMVTYIDVVSGNPGFPQDATVGGNVR